MQLTLIRHLQTDYNVRGLLQGRKDFPILMPNEDQLSEIKTNKERIRNSTEYNHILVSNLIRTRMTAELYVDTYKVEPLLDELNFGSWEGKKKNEMIKANPQWLDRPDLLTLGEPLSDLEKRVKDFLLKYSSAEKVLVFSHGAWSRALISLHRFGSIRQMNTIHIPNNTIIHLDTNKEA